MLPTDVPVQSSVCSEVLHGDELCLEGLSRCDPKGGVARQHQRQQQHKLYTVQVLFKTVAMVTSLRDVTKRAADVFPCFL